MLSTRTVICRRGVGVAGVVGGHDAEVVLAVGLRRRIPARGLVRPRACADRRALELNGREARAAVSGVTRQRDGVSEVGCVRGSGDRAGRIRVVDPNSDRRGGERVAGEVGRDDPEVVLAVGLQVRVPARGLARPGAGARGGALEGDGVDARAAEVRGAAREHNGAANVGCVGRVRDGAGRVRVVDEDGDRRRGEGVAGVVGGHDAEVVRPVGLCRRVPARGLVRPGTCARGGALEGDGVDARAAGIGRVAGQGDGVADVGGVGRSGDRAGRVRVVDADGDRRGGEGVAGVVGGDDAEVVLAVGLCRGVPARGLVRPGARADRRALELDGRDARATGVGGAARQRRSCCGRWQRQPEQ